MAEKKDIVCLEVSYEVCNKVGGIHTVLKSKSAMMKKVYKNYYAFGYFNPNNYDDDFIEEKIPEKFNEVIKRFEEKSIHIKFGRWFEASNIKCFLIDTRDYRSKMMNDDTAENHIKKELWDLYKIDSYSSKDDFDHPVVWAWCTGMFIKELADNVFNENKIVVHCHEWLSGACNLYLKNKNFNGGLVFTSHATVMGRLLSQINPQFIKQVYEGLDKKHNLDVERAYEHKLESKHLIEKSCAEQSDVFTTVSEITADEAEHVLGIRPQIITFNAFDFEVFPGVEKLLSKKQENVRKIHDFLMLYFLPYYKIDLKNALFFYIMGRHEFKGKGIDVFIDSLGELNKFLKKEESSKEVFAFIWVPFSVKGRKESVRINYNKFNNVKRFVDENCDEIRRNIIKSITYNRDFKEFVFSSEFMNDAISLSHDFRSKEGKPPLCAFELVTPEEDSKIIQALKRNKLNNEKDDKVKIVYYPIYLSRNDDLLGMEIYDALNGCDLGVFPSLYEPWGYTPVEAGSMLNAAITTDLAGFGRFIMDEVNNDSKGIRVVKRLNKSHNEVVEQIFDYMKYLINLDDEELLMEKTEARELVERSDWKIQINKYTEAHEKALKIKGLIE